MQKPSRDEREEPKLIGFLPAGIDKEDPQVDYAPQQVCDNPTDLEWYSSPETMREGEL